MYCKHRWCIINIMDTEASTELRIYSRSKRLNLKRSCEPRMFGQHLKPRVVTVGVIRTATYLCCVRWLGDCSRAPILAYRNLIRQDTYGIACYQTMKGDTDEAVRGPGQRVVASPIRRSLRDLTVCRWDSVVKYLVRAGRLVRTLQQPPGIGSRSF